MSIGAGVGAQKSSAAGGAAGGGGALWVSSVVMSGEFLLACLGSSFGMSRELGGGLWIVMDLGIFVKRLGRVLIRKSASEVRCAYAF